VNFDGLYEAGFRTVRVEGVLWELIPPRGEGETAAGESS
jgi:hypothetical protein